MNTMAVVSIQNQNENPYLDWIKSGTKTYEGRTLNKIKDWGLFVGKQIKFFDKKNIDSYVICEVTELLHFDDFGQAFDALGEKLIPNRTRNEVIRLYNGFYEPNNKYEDGITSDFIKGLKVVAIGVKVIL